MSPSSNQSPGHQVHVGRCSRIDRDSWAAASRTERREYQKERLRARRRRQLERAPNVGHQQSGSIAKNPHKNLREIARRARQSAPRPTA